MQISGVEMVYLEFIAFPNPPKLSNFNPIKEMWLMDIFTYTPAVGFGRR